MYIAGLWGKLLANFGVVYVKDMNNTFIPTFAEYDPEVKSILKSSEYQAIVDCDVDEDIKKSYLEKARALDEVYKRIDKELSSKEEYDVFICTKISRRTSLHPDNEGYTEDSRIADDFYYGLQDKKVKVFYSDKCCQGIEYDSQILSALLRSNKIIIIATEKDYLESPWVQSEWRRWLNFIECNKKDKDSIYLYLPHYEKDSFDLPRPLKKVQRFTRQMQVMNLIIDNSKSALEERQKQEAELKRQEELKEKKRLERLAKEEQKRKQKEKERIARELQAKKQARNKNLKSIGNVITTPFRVMLMCLWLFLKGIGIGFTIPFRFVWMCIKGLGVGLWWCIKKISGIFSYAISIIGGLLIAVPAVICIANLFKNQSIYTNEALQTFKISFYIMLVLLGLAIVFLIIEYITDEKGYYNFKFGFEGSEFVHGFRIIAHVISGVGILIFVLLFAFNNTLKIQKYYVDEDGGVVYTLKKDGYVAYNTIDNRKEITILGTVDGSDVVGCHKNNFRKNEYIRKISFESGDFIIEDSVLKDCTKLTYISFDEYQYTIYDHAFLNCDDIREVNVGHANIKFPEEGYSVFGSSNKLTIRIDGGTLENPSFPVNKYIVSSDSIIEIKTAIVNRITNQTIVFEEGVTFKGSTFINEHNAGFFTSNLKLYPIATTFYIPQSAEKLLPEMFGDTIESKITINYAGTQEEWNRLVQSCNNSIVESGYITVNFNTVYEG